MTDKWDRRVRLEEWYPLWNKYELPRLEEKKISDKLEEFPDQKTVDGEGWYMIHQITKEIVCPICEETREIRHTYEGPNYWDALGDAEDQHFELTCGGLCDRCLRDFHQVLVKKGVNVENIGPHGHDAQGRCLDR
jgi:hypothetical protein